MADAPGRVPCAAEMRAFDAEIGGDQQLVAAADAQHSSVVTDPNRYRCGFGASQVADARDQFGFRQRQDEP